MVLCWLPKGETQTNSWTKCFFRKKFTSSTKTWFAVWPESLQTQTCSPMSCASSLSVTFSSTENPFLANSWYRSCVIGSKLTLSLVESGPLVFPFSMVAGITITDSSSTSQIHLGITVDGKAHVLAITALLLSPCWNRYLRSFFSSNAVY